MNLIWDWIDGLSLRSVVLVFGIIGLLIYSNMLGNQFVDDDSQLQINSAFHSVLSIPSFFIKGDGGNVGGGYYRPVADTILTLEYKLFGYNPTGYHLVQLILHIVISILVYIILKSYLGKSISFVFGLIFLTHPMNVESVAYISAIREILFVLFGLLALISTNFRWVGIFLFLTIFSKETGVIFLLLKPLQNFLNNKNWLFTTKLSFSIFIFYLLLRFSSGISFSKKAIVPIMELSLWERIINVPNIVSYYISNFLYPLNILSNQSWVVKQTSVMAILVLFILCLFVLITYRRYKKRAIFFSILFLLGLGAHLQVIPLDLTVADRWFYLPVIGLLGLLGLSLEKYSKLLIGPILVIIIFLGIISVERNSDWKNSLSLASHDIQNSKNDDYLLEKRYGTELMITGNDEQALIHLNKANSLFPKNYGVWNNLGNIYLKKGLIVEAKNSYLKSIENDNFYGAYENLAFLYLNYESKEQANEFMLSALNVYPKSEKLLRYYLLNQQR